MGWEKGVANCDSCYSYTCSPDRAETVSELVAHILADEYLAIPNWADPGSCPHILRATPKTMAVMILERIPHDITEALQVTPTSMRHFETLARSVFSQLGITVIRRYARKLDERNRVAGLLELAIQQRPAVESVRDTLRGVSSMAGKASGTWCPTS